MILYVETSFIVGKSFRDALIDWSIRRTGVR
jgi:hypothetical protein